MSALWSDGQEAEYQRMLAHIETCTVCELVRPDNSASTCAELVAVLDDMHTAGQETVS